MNVYPKIPTICVCTLVRAIEPVARRLVVYVFNADNQVAIPISSTGATDISINIAVGEDPLHCESDVIASRVVENH